MARRPPTFAPRPCQRPTCGATYTPINSSQLYCGPACYNLALRQGYKIGRSGPTERLLAALAARKGRASWTLLMAHSGCSETQLKAAVERLVTDGILDWSTREVPIREREVLLTTPPEVP